jgi:hypothetical protein
MYLLTKNLKIKKKSKKLNHVKIESFFIKAIKESINYELDLSKNAKVFLVFHILLLKSVDLSTFIQETFHYKSQKKNRFEVKKILKKKDHKTCLSSHNKYTSSTFYQEYKSFLAKNSAYRDASQTIKNRQN